MPKYKPLHDYLRRKSQREIEMSFTQVDRILSNMLQKSASRPQWWANERSTETTHVQCSAWLAAGYEASLLPRERVVFRRRAPANLQSQT